MTVFILSLAVLLQFLAAVFCLRLIKVTGNLFAWGAISLAMIGLTIVQGMALYSVLYFGETFPSGYLFEAGTLSISLLLFFGMVSIGPLFKEMRANNEELKRRENLLVDAQRIAKLGIYELDFRDGSAWWPDEMYLRHGYSRDSFTPTVESLINHTHEDDRERVKQALETFVESGTNDPLVIDYCVAVKGRDEYFVHAILTPIKDKNGKTIRCRGVSQDVSELRKAEEELRNNEKQLVNAQKLAQMGNWYYDTITGKLTCSDEFYRIFGFSLDKKEELTREIIMAAIHPEDSKAIDSRIDKVVETGLSSTDEYRVVRPDGNVRQIATSREPVLASDGSVIAINGIVQDITERKHLEKQLLQSQKLEAVGQLTGGIAHDFNNILQSILGYSQLSIQMVKDTGEEKLVRYIKEIVSGGERASQLVSKMLTFSRSESEPVRPVCIGEYVENTVSLLKGSLPSSVELNVSIDASLPAIRIDPIQLEQMLMNLCINARDAMSGMGTLEISVRQVSLDNRASIIPGFMSASDVKRLDICHCDSDAESHRGAFSACFGQDSGQGMDDIVLGHLFEPFYSTKSKAEGAGMGLAVIHGIMKSMRAHIVVETKNNEGSVFSLFFPVAADAEVGKNIQPPPVVVDARAKAGNLLIVDDEASILDFMTVLLEEHDYGVTRAVDGETALEVFSGSPGHFDLVLTDHTMPRMSGVELAQELLAIRPELPIIMCSGYSDVVDEDTARLAGIRAYIKKPARAKQMLKLVSETLDKQV